MNSYTSCIALKCKPQYDRIELSEDGKYAVVYKEGKQSVYSIASGKEILPTVFSYIAPLGWQTFGKGYSCEYFVADDH